MAPQRSNRSEKYDKQSFPKTAPETGASWQAWTPDDGDSGTAYSVSDSAHNGADMNRGQNEKQRQHSRPILAREAVMLDQEWRLQIAG